MTTSLKPLASRKTTLVRKTILVRKTMTMVVEEEAVVTVADEDAGEIE